MLFSWTVENCLPKMPFPHPKWQRILGGKSLPVKIKFSDDSTLLVMRCARAGDLLTIGCVYVPQTASLLESLGIWSCVMPEGP